MEFPQIAFRQHGQKRPLWGVPLHNCMETHSQRHRLGRFIGALGRHGNIQALFTNQSPRNDIEASWLLWDAAQTLGKPQVQERLQPLCLKIADATLREAVDPDGAVLNERRNSDGHLDTDRIWWVQAEAILGFLNAWQMSGSPLYREAAERCWQYTHTHLRDTLVGEWYWRVGRQGEHFPEEDKAGFWKCPYHNGRMLLFGSRPNITRTPKG